MLESRRAISSQPNKDVWTVATDDLDLLEDAASTLYEEHPAFSSLRPKHTGNPSSHPNIYNAIRNKQDRNGGESKSWPPDSTPGLKLERLVQDSTSDVDATWDFFLKKFGTGGGTALSRTKLSDRIRVERGDMFKKLLERVMTKWCDKTTGSLPTPAEVIEVFELSEIMKPEYYVQSLWILIRALMKARLSGEPHLDPAASKAAEDQLMIIWSRVFQLFSKGTRLINFDAKPLSVDWSHLPKISGQTFYNDQTTGYVVGSVPMRLGRVLPRFTKQYHHQLSSSVLATFALLGPHKDASTGLFNRESSEHKPLMLVLSSILYRTDIARPAQFIENVLTENSVGNVGPLLQSVASFMDLVQNTPFMAMMMLSTESGGIASNNSGLDVAHDALENHFSKLVERIDEKARYGDLEKVWANAKSAFDLLGKGSQKAMSAQLYHLFIRASYRSGNPGAAIEVWNDMISAGIKPTISQWTEMILGAGRQKDVEAVEKMWQRMLDSGMVPDAQAWTVRIRAMIMCGKTKKGLNLLEEWSRDWVSAAEASIASQKASQKVDIPLSHMTDMPGIPKPNSRTLNSVLNVLVFRRDHNQIQQLLGWAASMGISTDIFTFNKLMNMHLEDGCVKEAIAILDQMPGQGVQPDVATFTMLIDGIYKSEAGAEMTLEQQQNFATEVLEMMEKLGTEANLITFGALINGLLNNGNLEAAKSVLLYMEDRGKPCPPQIHTVLMKYFFSQEEPDTASVKDIWQKVNTADLKADSLFFNTMVQGFASVNEFDLTLQFLTKMSRNGMDPTWTTLSTALRALVDAGQRDRAQAIVDGAASAMARGSMGIGSGSMKGTSERQRDAFWALAESVGMRPTRSGP